MPLLPDLPYFSEPDTNRRFLNEQEGFEKILSHAADETPRCSSVLVSTGTSNNDFRGPMPTSGRTQDETDFIEWETTPAAAQGDCTFCFIMNTHVYPEYRPAYPYVTATLSVGGAVGVPVPVGVARGFQTARDGVNVYFEPRRFASMVETYHRKFDPQGVSGIYRVTVPERLITAGKPVNLKFTLDKTDMDVVSYASLSPRGDVLSLSLATLRNEMRQLQSDMVELKLSHAMLAAKIYPEMFPQFLIDAKRGVAVIEETWHMHPPSLCVYDDDCVLLTYRRATDHLAANGACWAVRSFDKGATFTKIEKLFDLGYHDHRNTPLRQISNGDLVGADYRVRGGYDEKGRYDGDRAIASYTLWGVWSDDKGKTWNFTDEPISAPGTIYPLAEMERPLIELPNGRLLLTAMYAKDKFDDGRGYLFAMGVWSSDDKGRSWQYLSSTEPYAGVEPPHLEGEPTFIRCKSGKIVMMMRSEAFGHNAYTDWEKKGGLMQSESYDDGKTWTKPHPTKLPSLSTPAHLTLLHDGRLLVTHASRGYPCSVYVTLSDDEGETWQSGNTKIVTHDLPSFDATYPTTVQFKDGSFLTVWYANRFGKFHIGTARYTLEELA